MDSDTLSLCSICIPPVVIATLGMKDFYLQCALHNHSTSHQLQTSFNGIVVDSIAKIMQPKS
jgi:hypothetical protein